MNEYNSQQDCPNKFCVSHRKSADTTVAVHDKKHSRLRCRSCGKTWVVHYQSFHYGLRTPVIKIERAFDLLNAGFTIRKVAELVKTSPSTIMRWKNKNKS